MKETFREAKTQEDIIKINLKEVGYDARNWMDIA